MFLEEFRIQISKLIRWYKKINYVCIWKEIWDPYLFLMSKCVLFSCSLRLLIILSAVFFYSQAYVDACLKYMQCANLSRSMQERASKPTFSLAWIITKEREYLLCRYICVCVYVCWEKEKRPVPSWWCIKSLALLLIQC